MYSTTTTLFFSIENLPRDSQSPNHRTSQLTLPWNRLHLKQYHHLELRINFLSIKAGKKIWCTHTPSQGLLDPFLRRKTGRPIKAKQNRNRTQASQKKIFISAKRAIEQEQSELVDNEIGKLEYRVPVNITETNLAPWRNILTPVPKQCTNAD